MRRNINEYSCYNKNKSCKYYRQIIVINGDPVLILGSLTSNDLLCTHEFFLL